jgi:hypothetical protein
MKTLRHRKEKRNTQHEKGGGVAQVFEHLPTKCATQSSNPSIMK